MRGYLIALVIGCGLGAWITVKSMKPVVQVKTETVTKIQEHVVVHEKKNVDGSVETLITKDTGAVIDAKSDSKPTKSKYFVTIDRKGLLTAEGYSVSISKRVLGDFFIHATVDSKGQPGIGVGYEF